MAEKSVQEIIKGIIYAEFDDITGPIAKAYQPTSLSPQALNQVASITIDAFMNENHVPDKLIIIPFPSINKNGLMRAVIIKDSQRRGGLITGTLTVLFDEENDAIFYKFRQDFEGLFQIFVQKIISLREKKEKGVALQATLAEFNTVLVNLLNQLYARENPFHSFEEFPSIAEDGGNERNYALKMLVIGDPRVGKTSAILQYTDKAFNQSYLPTVGFNLTLKHVQLQNSYVRLVLWDLAGQAKYNLVRDQIYRGAVGAVIVYDVTNRKSFENVPNWYKDVKEYHSKRRPLVILLCGNKCDLVEERVITPEEGKAVAQQLGVSFLETSARTGENITEAFETLAQILVQYIMAQKEPSIGESNEKKKQ